MYRQLPVVAAAVVHVLPSIPPCSLHLCCCWAAELCNLSACTELGIRHAATRRHPLPEHKLWRGC
jgi:hypothetical protein